MQVVYEDNHIIIVAKRSGEIVQGDKTGDTPLSDVVKEYLKEKYQKPGNVFLGVTHRLDRPVSGLVVFARTSKALARLNRMFAEGQVHKTYWAIVNREKGKVESGKWKVESEMGSADHSSFLIPHSQSSLTGSPAMSNRTSRTPMIMRCHIRRRPSCAIAPSPKATATSCSRWSCSRAATIRYAASWLPSACPSRAT